MGLADAFWRDPRSGLCPERHLPAGGFGGRRVLHGAAPDPLVEEGQPDYSTLHQHHSTALPYAMRRKVVSPLACKVPVPWSKAGLVEFLRAYRPDLLPARDSSPENTRIAAAVSSIAPNVQGRPPSVAPGCPERPIFAAIKLAERELGHHHISSDIGCHLFSTFPPFEIGNTVMGDGLGGSAPPRWVLRRTRDRNSGRWRLLA